MLSIHLLYAVLCLWSSLFRHLLLLVCLDTCLVPQYILKIPLLLILLARNSSSMLSPYTKGIKVLKMLGQEKVQRAIYGCQHFEALLFLIRGSTYF